MVSVNRFALCWRSPRIINSSINDCDNRLSCAHFTIFNLSLKIRISHFKSVLLLLFEDLSIDNSEHFMRMICICDRVLAPRRDFQRTIDQGHLSLGGYNQLILLYSCLRVGCDFDDS